MIPPISAMFTEYTVGDVTFSVAFTAACPQCKTDVEWVHRRSFTTAGTPIGEPEYIIPCPCQNTESLAEVERGTEEREVEGTA